MKGQTLSELPYKVRRLTGMLENFVFVKEFELPPKIDFKAENVVILIYQN